jgi:hypothetical protein
MRTLQLASPIQYVLSLEFLDSNLNKAWLA